LLIGQAYNEMLTATGGFGSYTWSTWSVTSGELPQGIILQTRTGQISCFFRRYLL